MDIIPVKALADNYIWMIREGNLAVCVDPGEADPVIGFALHQKLVLAQIWITHAHRDHTGGIEGICGAFSASPVYGAVDIDSATHTVREGVQFDFGSGRVTVWATPGHTAHHVGYLLEHSDGLHVFCGDTLFSAGCGRVFTGTVEELYGSFQRFNRLPADTLFYPAHEYTAANLRFAAHIEPDNADIQTALAQERIPTLPVALGHERRVNPFLRTAQPQVRARAEELSGRMLETDFEVFAALRELKNRF